MGASLHKSRFRQRNSEDNHNLPKESFDLWEERRGIFTFTTAATLAGLNAAAKLGHVFKDEKFCKMLDLFRKHLLHLK